MNIKRGGTDGQEENAAGRREEGGEEEDVKETREATVGCYLLGHDVTKSDRSSPKIRRNLLIPSSGSNNKTGGNQHEERSTSHKTRIR
jgi:hypothetical protein